MMAESIPGLLKRLSIRALLDTRTTKVWTMKFLKLFHISEQCALFKPFSGQFLWSPLSDQQIFIFEIAAVTYEN